MDFYKWKYWAAFIILEGGSSLVENHIWGSFTLKSFPPVGNLTKEEVSFCLPLAKDSVLQMKEISTFLKVVPPVDNSKVFCHVQWWTLTVRVFLLTYSLIVCSTLSLLLAAPQLAASCEDRYHLATCPNHLLMFYLRPFNLKEGNADEE